MDKLSRRDFLKIVGVGAGALAIRPIIAELGNNLEKETVLIGARQFLIQNESIPPGIENVPSANEHFIFADQLLEKSLATYKDWALKENLPQPFFRKSKSYFDYRNAKSFNDIGQFGSAQYSSFLSDLFNKDYKPNGTDDFLGKFKERLEATLTYAGSFLTDYAEKKQSLGSKPITFSNEILYDAKSYLWFNPGSAILNRVCSTLGTGNYDDLEGREDEIGAVLHKEIDPIWAWIRNHVAKSGKPMTSDVFLAKLLYENRGNITESLWDKVVLEKLMSRSNPTTFEFNSDVGWLDKPNYQQYIDPIKNNQDMFLGLIQDNFAPRLSANYINKNVRQDELFGYNHFTDIYKDAHNYKPFDSYCAAGNIYHGSNDMALATTTSPEILQLMILYKNFYADVGRNIAPNSDYGLEKVTADLLVGYRAKEIRKILDNYSV